MIFIDPVTCLAAALYFEARDQNLGHQLMVANTITNRVMSKRFPNTICDVVKQYKQFSFFWDGQKEIIDDPKSWDFSIRWSIHWLVNDMEYHDACHYAVKTVKRVWMKDMTREVHGTHAFYEGGC